MAIPAFFRFTSVTVLLLFLFRFTNVTQGIQLSIVNVRKSALKSIKLPSLKIVHFKQLRRVAKFYRGLYLVGKLVRLYAAAVLLIPRGLCGLGRVVRAHARSYGKRRLITTQAKRARSSPTPPLSSVLTAHYSGYLTIIPRARMGSESIAHEA